MTGLNDETVWSCCGHAAMYHGPEVPGCAECRCRITVAPTQETTMTGTRAREFTHLTQEEHDALRYASTPIVPMERLELLAFLGWPEDLPNGRDARVLAVMERILETRGARPVDFASTAAPGNRPTTRDATPCR